MFFEREDELAIHTVASAAYSVLSDLKSDRGRDEAGDHQLNAIFYVVRDYRRGTLPNTFSEDPEAMRWICEWAELLPITATSEFKDIVAYVEKDDRKRFWDKRNRIANFLKHADRDPRSHISLNDLDNLELLMYALGAYVDLTNDLIHPEGYVFFVYHGAITQMNVGMSDTFRKLVSEVEKIDPDEQIDFCAAMLNEMRKD